MLIEMLMKMLMFWNDLFEDDILLRCRRILNRLWNVDWVVDENVIVLKWFVWGRYIIALLTNIKQTIKYWLSC
jgi:hypothetical protein